MTEKHYSQWRPSGAVGVQHVRDLAPPLLLLHNKGKYNADVNIALYQYIKMYIEAY